MQDIPSRSNQSAVYLLRRNDPRRTYIELVLYREPDDATLAQALHENPHVRHITLRIQYQASRRDWTRLLAAVASHPGIHTVEVADDDTTITSAGGPNSTSTTTTTARHLRPFWKSLLSSSRSRSNHNQQSSSHIHTLHLVGIHCLSNQFVTDCLKNKTSFLRTLTLCRCSTSTSTSSATTSNHSTTTTQSAARVDRVATSLASALSTNSTLQELNLIGLQETFMLTILEALQSNTTVLRLAVDVSGDLPSSLSEPTCRSLTQLLTTNTAITRFHFAAAASSSSNSNNTNRQSREPSLSFRELTQVLIESQSVTAVVFSNSCWEDAELVRLLQTKRNLHTLGLFNCPTVSAPCLDALITLLRRPDSPLQALEFCYSCSGNEPAAGQGFFPESGDGTFARLLGMIEQSQCLKRLCLQGLNAVKLGVLAARLPSMPRNLVHVEFCCCDFPAYDEALFVAIRRNYSLQSVQGRVHIPHEPAALTVSEPLLGNNDDDDDDHRRAQLAVIMQRNTRLAEWSRDPAAAVPQCLWAEALALALEADHEEFFCALLLEMAKRSLDDNHH